MISFFIQKAIVALLIRNAVAAVYDPSRNHS